MRYLGVPATGVLFHFIAAVFLLIARRPFSTFDMFCRVKLPDFLLSSSCVGPGSARYSLRVSPGPTDACNERYQAHAINHCDIVLQYLV